MRPALKLLPALLLASLPALAQEAPRVLFCSGGCFAVDAKGVRTPAPKGTVLAPGQRLETGPNGYAQVRMGQQAAVGVSEQARVRFEPNTVVLDEGRVRLVGGAAIGRPDSAPLNLRTGDGTLVLRSPDVEVKRVSLNSSVIAPTLVKLNSGDGSLRSSQGDIALPRQDIQGISGGRLLSPAVVPANGLHPVSRSTLASAPARPAPVATLPTPIRLPTTLTRDPIVLSPTISPTLSPTILTTTTLSPVVSTGDTLLRQPIVDSSTGTTTTLTKIISEPVLTTSTTSTTTTSLRTLSLQPAPTTSTTTTLSPLNTSTRFIIR